MAIKTAHQHGLHTSVFLMIGLPAETYDDVMATIHLMAQAQTRPLSLVFFLPVSGYQSQ